MVINMEENKYPIYYFSASWDQPDFKNNGIGMTKMYKTKPATEKLEIDLEKFKKRIENTYKVLEWHDINYKFIENETWALIWFDHLTYNKFNSDSEAFESFENYISRKKDIVGNLDSLMGAEDRWRWEVCHCDGCKKNDWVIIKH